MTIDIRPRSRGESEPSADPGSLAESGKTAKNIRQCQGVKMPARDRQKAGLKRGRIGGRGRKEMTFDQDTSVGCIQPPHWRPHPRCSTVQSTRNDLPLAPHGAYSKFHILFPDTCRQVFRVPPRAGRRLGETTKRAIRSFWYACIIWQQKVNKVLWTRYLFTKAILDRFGFLRRFSDS